MFGNTHTHTHTQKKANCELQDSKWLFNLLKDEDMIRSNLESHGIKYDFPGIVNLFLFCFNFIVFCVFCVFSVVFFWFFWRPLFCFMPKLNEFLSN